MTTSVFSEKTLETIQRYRGEICMEGQMAEPHRTLKEISIDFLKYTEDYLLGEIMSRAGLSLRDRSLIIIAALAVNRYEFVATGHMRWALNIGITREEVFEVIMLIAHYGGWPFGKEIFNLLESAYPGYLRNILEKKAEAVQSSRRLSLREQILVQIGALAARRFNNRLKEKMRIALNLGITQDEILETVMQVTPYAGWPVGIEALRVAKDVFSSNIGEKAPNSGLSESQEKGREIVRRLIGDSDDGETFKLIRDIFPDFMKVVTEEHLFGRIWSRPLLSLRDRCMITIAVLIAFRFNQDLKSHMRFALNSGLTHEEVLEIIMQSANYTCWGAGVGAVYCAKEVFGSGNKEKSPKFDSSILQEKGKDVIRKLLGGEERDELFDLIGNVSPDFLKVITEQHLFGEVWSRPGLVLRDRCMITLAILVARGFRDELRSHMHYTLNVGMSRDEILEIILHTANYTCWGAGVGAILSCKDILRKI